VAGKRECFSPFSSRVDAIQKIEFRRRRAGQKKARRLVFYQGLW
jgi:hypothetical protein